MTDTGDGQAFSFSITDWAIAEAGGVRLDQLHTDAEAICKGVDAARPVAERLGIDAPIPKLAGFCYAPLAELGLPIEFPEDSEPIARPIIGTPEEIDTLEEPDDYLASPVTQQRLRVVDELKRLHPDAGTGIGHMVEGPVTTAVLIYGHDFLMLPTDDPERAHRLLDFSVRSMLHYAEAVYANWGGAIEPSPRGFPDDFAGMFAPAQFEEFVVPYWDRLYDGLKSTRRSVHSELLHVEHLPFLEQLGLEHYDPSADQYLTPEQLRDHCPCPFSLSIHPWHVHDMSTDELEDYYRHLSSFGPDCISFCMKSLDEEPKLQRLLAVAREMT
jgi:uroporphyrinogen-III decarboxylase